MLPVPDPLPVAQARACLPAADDGLALVHEELRGLDERRDARRPHRLGLVQQPRCPNCNKFVRIPDSCESCGFYGSRGLAA